MVWALLALTLPSLAQAQADIVCWNDRPARRYVKDVNAQNRRFHATIAIRPGGAVFVERRDARLWRVGYDPATSTEWVTAVTIPLDGGLAGRELVAADVSITSSSLVGQPIVNHVPWWYSGFAEDVPGGAVESLPLARYLQALTQPGWVDGTVQLTSTAATRFAADGIAEYAQAALEWARTEEGERPISSLTFFLTSADPAPAAAAYANLRQVSATIYHCPPEPDEWRGRGIARFYQRALAALR